MTRDELRERIVARIAELDESHEFVEPYEGAGYCVCDDCQKERPLLRDMLALLAAQAKATPLSDAAVAWIIEAVEKHCGMGHGAWDMVAARDLAEGFAAVFGADTRRIDAEAYAVIDEPSGAEAVVREAYAVIDELAPQWSGSSIASVLRAYLERMAVPYPWRPIETAPKDGSRVLLAGCGENGGWVCVASWRGGRWRDGDYSIEPPTHWMPLPTPPGEEEEGESDG